MPKDSLLRFKRISSSYEFFKLSFRLWLLIPSSIAALFLTNHIHVYSYFTSNVNYEMHDHQGNHYTIKFDVNNKTLKHPYYELYTSIEVIVKDFLIENFPLN